MKAAASLCLLLITVAQGEEPSLEALRSHVPLVRLNTVELKKRVVVPESCPLPDAFIDGEYHCKTTVFAESKRLPIVRLVERILEEYPRSVLEESLDRVLVVGDLTANGFSKLGLYWDRNVVVAAGDVDTPEQWEDLVRTVHHEISSIYFTSHAGQFSAKGWSACNPSGFAYQDKYTPGNDGFTTDVTETAAKDGFACSYGRQDIENDFNTIVENLFWPDKIFPSLLSRHERLRRKARLALDFLTAVDGGFRRMVDPRVLFLLTREAEAQ